LNKRLNPPRYKTRLLKVWQIASFDLLTDKRRIHTCIFYRFPLRMSSARNLQSNVSVADGSAAERIEKPKAPRPSICARSTADSAATRQKVAAKSKNSAILPKGGAFTAEKGTVVEGSTPKKHNIKGRSMNLLNDTVYSNLSFSIEDTVLYIVHSKH
jgi:hypothetical protein